MSGTPLHVLAAHLAHGLAAHRHWLAREGIAEPAELAAILEALKSLMRHHQPADEGPAGVGVETAYMRPLPLLLRLGEAAQQLGLSKAAVERLVASGDLPSVKVGGCRRVRRQDLERFVDGLAGHSFRDRVESKSPRTSPAGSASGGRGGNRPPDASEDAA